MIIIPPSSIEGHVPVSKGQIHLRDGGLDSVVGVLLTPLPPLLPSAPQPILNHKEQLARLHFLKIRHVSPAAQLAVLHVSVVRDPRLDPVEDVRGVNNRALSRLALLLEELEKGEPGENKIRREKSVLGFSNRVRPNVTR